MKLIKSKFKEIEVLAEELKKKEEEVDFEKIHKIQFTYMGHVNPVEIHASDTRLADLDLPHEQKYKLLFKIIEYKIVEITEHFQTLPNKNEILEIAEGWCNKWKNLEKENT